jgi:hypothetical protein
MKRIKSIGGKMALFGAAVAMLGLGRAQAAFLSYNATTQAVTFDPSEVVEPVVNAVVAAVLAGVALFVIARGVRWVYKVIGFSK